MEPFVNTHYAAVLFADISGFTRLSASLSEEKLRLHIKYAFIIVPLLLDPYSPSNAPRVL